MIALRRIAESLILGVIFALAFRFPAASGWGFGEAALALVFPALIFDAMFKKRHPGWLYLALMAGFGLLFHWVPATLAILVFGIAAIPPEGRALASRQVQSVLSMLDMRSPGARATGNLADSKSRLASINWASFAPGLSARINY